MPEARPPTKVFMTGIEWIAAGMLLFIGYQLMRFLCYGVLFAISFVPLDADLAKSVTDLTGIRQAETPVAIPDPPQQTSSSEVENQRVIDRRRLAIRLNDNLASAQDAEFSTVVRWAFNLPATAARGEDGGWEVCVEYTPKEQLCESYCFTAAAGCGNLVRFLPNLDGSVTITFQSDFPDMYGRVSTEEAMSFSVDVDEVRRINWENFVALNFFKLVKYHDAHESLKPGLIALAAK